MKVHGIIIVMVKKLKEENSHNAKPVVCKDWEPTTNGGKRLLTQRTQQCRYNHFNNSKRISLSISVEQPFFCYGQFSEKEKHLKITFAPFKMFIWSHEILCSCTTGSTLLSVKTLALLWVIKIFLSGHIWDVEMPRQLLNTAPESGLNFVSRWPMSCSSLDYGSSRLTVPKLATEQGQLQKQ